MTARVPPPTTRRVAAVLRAAGHRSYASARQHQCPAMGYEVMALGSAVRVTWCDSSARLGDASPTLRDAALTAWAEVLSRWDVRREGSASLVVREREVRDG